MEAVVVDLEIYLHHRYRCWKHRGEIQCCTHRHVLCDGTCKLTIQYQIVEFNGVETRDSTSVCAMAIKRRSASKREAEHDSQFRIPDDARELEISSSDEEDEFALAERETEDAILDYADALRKTSSNTSNAEGSSKDEDDSGSDSGSDAREDGPGDVEDDGSDSSEEERPQRNTVGEVPLRWYADEEHIGYDQEGTKLIKKERKDKLDQLLDKNDSALGWRTVYDAYNDEEVVLSKEEMKMIQHIRSGRFSHLDVNPFPDENDWFSRHQESMPLSAAPEPKRRFTPSKWEEKKIVKLVRAMRKGWLSTNAPPKKPELYLMWSEDGEATDKTVSGLTYLAAPKMKLPGHDESYNPPKEYLMSKEEENAAKLEAEDNEDAPPFIPSAFDALRKVPAYDRYINERFERCLDLYLCPRSRVKRMDLSDPEALVPKLPKPRDLQPFPTILSLKYLGHTGQVTSLSVDPLGQWLLSGSRDGTARMWEIQTGRCMSTFRMGAPVRSVSWCPKKSRSLAAVAVGKKVILVPLRANKNYSSSNEEIEEILAKQDGSQTDQVIASWAEESVESTQGSVICIAIEHPSEVSYLSWHSAGDYFCSVCPRGNTKAILVHQLSKGATQNPFRKNRGIVTRAIFHPVKPFFFVATQQAIRVYNLAKQSLAKKLVAGSGVITSMSIHPSGDHIIVGSEDRRVCWYDLDLSSKPYKALRYHEHAVRSVSFHPMYPLFASSSDDGTAHIFHGRVYSDLMTNPLIVPVKIIKGHARADSSGVNDVAFHPRQPWAFTAGADGQICLFVNP